MQTGEDSFPVFVLRACLILDVEGTEFPAPLAQLRIGRAKGAGNLDIQNPKSKIQDSKSPHRGFVSHSRWEYRRPGGGDGRGKKDVKIYFLLVTHTEIRQLGGA